MCNSVDPADQTVQEQLDLSLQSVYALTCLSENLGSL